MGGLSEGIYEPSTEICVCYTDITPTPYPSVDITTRGHVPRALEYEYQGHFDNAYSISGGDIETPDRLLRVGLLLSGEVKSNNVILTPSIYLPDTNPDTPIYSFHRIIDNSGSIGGRDYSIYSPADLNDFDNLIRNNGKLTSDVSLGDGLDQIINHGRILGDIDTGGRADSSGTDGDYIANFGFIQGRVTLGAGDSIFTSFGNARVGSKKKPAAVMGMDGNDTLTGANRADKFLGGKGQDTLIGGDGDDRLIGNQDDDLLRGDAGNDLLAGGLGKDWMFGGDGADVFLFGSVLTSQGNGMADRIADFETGTDRIDLSRIADSIDFIGMGDFTGTGQTELRYDVGDRGTAQVFLDVDGDGQSDMRINLLKTDALSEADFIL